MIGSILMVGGFVIFVASFLYQAYTLGSYRPKINSEITDGLIILGLLVFSLGVVLSVF